MIKIYRLDAITAKPFCNFLIFNLKPENLGEILNCQIGGKKEKKTSQLPASLR